MVGVSNRKFISEGPRGESVWQMRRYVAGKCLGFQVMLSGMSRSVDAIALRRARKDLAHRVAIELRTVQKAWPFPTYNGIPVDLPPYLKVSSKRKKDDLSDFEPAPF